MTTRAKFLVGFLICVLAIAAIASLQERRQLSILDDLRGSLAVGDGKEKVERVLREHGLVPVITASGRTCTAHVWFHFQPDVAVVIALDAQGTIAAISVIKHRE